MSGAVCRGKRAYADKMVSIKEAIDFAKHHMPDAFLAVGGGSVIDTAKLMNLYACNPGTCSSRCDIEHY